MTPNVDVCDGCDAEWWGCDAEWWGASKLDVLEAGWKFHDAKRGRFFLMCGECGRRFGPRSVRRVRHSPSPR